MEIKELLIALKGEGLDGDELISVLKQNLRMAKLPKRITIGRSLRFKRKKTKKKPLSY